MALVDPTRVRDEHQQQPGRGERHHFAVFHMASPQVGELHDGGLAGELAQELRGAMQHVLQVDAVFEEGQYGAAFRIGEGFDVAKGVDKQPVPFLGGEPARAGMLLADIAFGL